MRNALALAMAAFTIMIGPLFLNTGNWELSAAEKPIIPACGYRQRFQIPAYIVYDDETNLGTKSIHCLGIYLALELPQKIAMIAVGDFFTKQTIDAEEAVWVIGDAAPGEATKRSLVPFGRELDAQAFMQRYGGRLGNFDEIMKIVFQDLADDWRNRRSQLKRDKK